MKKSLIIIFVLTFILIGFSYHQYKNKIKNDYDQFIILDLQFYCASAFDAGLSSSIEINKAIIDQYERAYAEKGDPNINISIDITEDTIFIFDYVNTNSKTPGILLKNYSYLDYLMNRNVVLVKYNMSNNPTIDDIDAAHNIEISKFKDFIDSTHSESK